MTRTRTRHPSPYDLANAERLYQKDKNPLYIALAIGAEPAMPPIWAMEAAIKLARDAASATRHGNDRIQWGRMLDDMFREFFRLHNLNPIGAAYTPPTLSSVITTVLEKHNQNDESTRKGLESAWRREAKGYEVEPAGVPENDRWRRMVREWGDQNTAFPHAEFQDEIWRLRRLGKI